jgi:hypothetical protein
LDCFWLFRVNDPLFGLIISDKAKKFLQHWLQFEPSMLYDFTDFSKVLHTLSKLSQTPKARIARPAVSPFPNSKTW